MSMTLRQPVGRRRSIGLDIGSSAVRAAEVVVDGRRRELVRFAQVGLPAGAVVEGEVRDPRSVAGALKRLWDEGGFSGRSVVLGVSSQRAMVRLIDMPAMEGKELRSALGYEIGELLPIPVDQAVYDFAVLGPGRPTGDGGETVQVLVVVAQKDIVRDQIAAVRLGGLRVRAVDASSLALLRAVPSLEAEDALDAVVSLGAQLVVVALRQGDVPRFMRTATVGVETEVAARAGAATRGGAAQGRERPEGRRGASKLEPVIEEVRSSIEYFLSHAQGPQLARVQLTGGAARTAGLAERLSSTLGVPVEPATLDLLYERSALGLEEERLEEASWRWTTAAGLALWGTQAGVRSPSLVPPEVAERAQQRRVMAAAGAGVVLVTAGLGALSHSRIDAIDSAKAKTRADQQEAAILQREILKLQSLGQVKSEVQARRQLAVEALANDIDWVGLDGRIVKALPGGVTITQVSFSSSPPAQTTPQTSSPTSYYVGQVTITGDTTAGLPSVARFVKAMTAVRGLGAAWVASTNSVTQPTAAANGRGARVQAAGEMQFSATAEVTNAALSKRAASLPGGTK
jgi:type IV pilus assembly protein PilM